jgi:hypothetical protein
VATGSEVSGARYALIRSRERTGSRGSHDRSVCFTSSLGVARQGYLGLRGEGGALGRIAAGVFKGECEIDSPISIMDYDVMMMQTFSTCSN